MKNTNILLLVLFNCLISVLNGQSLEENFIKTTEYLDEFDLSQKKTTLQYFDGLGRPIQIINHKQSPFGKDIIQHIEYDEFGRQVKEFLPFTKDRTSINIERDAAEKTMTYYYTKYGSQIAYSEKEIEASSLNRLLKQAAPGDDWALGSGNEIKFDYQTNHKLNDKVRIYSVNSNNSLNQNNNSYYPTASLYKIITKDENHEGNTKLHTIEEFKNKQGQVILKRTYDNNQTHDTYYVYDIYGNLTYVLPPKVNHNGSVTSQIINELCYQYKYDDRNRLVEKKLPGKEWEYMVYDKQNRLVATQDGNMRSTNATINPFNLTQKVWLFTKYDKFGRVAYTGLYKNNGSRTQIQNLVNGMGSNNENRGNNFSLNSITVNYSKDGGFPQNNAESEILSVNYYDDYNFPGAITTPSSVFGEQVISVTPNSSTHYVTTKNLPTASFVRVLGGNLWEKTFTYYDAKSRPIQTYKINHLQGRTIVNNEFDFRGKVLKTKTTHNRTNADPILTTQSEFSYDHAERLIKQTFQVNNESVQSLAVHEYDDLGQLKTKKVGGSNTFSNPLQIIDYKYNIRGWMTDINDIDNLNPTSQPQDLFAFKINYNQLTAGANQPADVEKLYNGNISQTFWRTANDNKLRGYAYSYDALNRLNTAYYRKGTTYSNNFNESLSYDKNGNILSLQRWGVPEDYGTVPAIPNMDDLSYTYFPNSNKLRKVSDGVASTKGFNDGVNLSTEYIYDPNANMKEDKNKGITEIKYNHLNLPTEIKFSNHQKIAYIYNALGTKIEKTVTNGSNISKTEYLDSFQYIDGELQFFPTSEGYVRKTDGTNRKWFDYVYNYTDHLGNIRLSYTTDPVSSGISGIKILEENNYYPFGLKHGLYNTPARDFRPVIDNREIEMVSDNPYNYKYNGKEWQGEHGLNVTSMDFRQYDNALGRFMNPDALSELAPMHTPYRFGFNNPVFWSDPTGLYEGRESIESFRYCPTCPESDNFDEFRDDPNANYVYNDETGVVTEIIELPDVVAVGEKSGSSSIHTTTYLGWANNGIGGFGEGLAKTTSKGGSVAVWSKPQVRSFDGIKYGELKAKYYSNNWTGNQYTGKTYNVAKVIKKGSIVTTAVLGTIEVGQGVAQDYENYQNTGSTDGKNTAVAGGSVVGGATGAWAGAKTGAVIGGVVGSAIPILGTGAGAIVGGIIGGVVGGIIGSEVGSAVVEEAYTYK